MFLQRELDSAHAPGAVGMVVADALATEFAS